MGKRLSLMALTILLIFLSSCGLIDEISDNFLPTPGDGFNAAAEFNKNMGIATQAEGSNPDSQNDVITTSMKAYNGDNISVIEEINIPPITMGQNLIISSGRVISEKSDLTAVTIGLRGHNDADMGKSVPATVSGKNASLANIELNTSDIGSGIYTVTVWAKNSTFTDPQTPLTEIAVTIEPIETINTKNVSSLRVLDIANAELGYTEGDSNKNKYADWYGSMQNEPWCAIFVSWCFSAADTLETIGTQFHYCPIGWNWYVKNNRAQYRKDGYVPQPGDLIFYDWDGTDKAKDHVGIVISSDGNVVNTIEGNTSGGKVATHQYNLSSSSITGYGQNFLTPSEPVRTHGEPLPPFKDVYVDMWYANSIKSVCDDEFMSVDDYGNFKPEVSLKRAEAWEVIAKINGTSTSGGNPWCFWTTEWAKQSKISDGANPERVATRQEVAVFLYNYIGQPSNDGSLNAADVNDVDHSMRKAMSWALSTGVIEGYECKILPRQTVSRGDYADIIVKFLNVAGSQIPREELKEIAPSLAGKVAEIKSYEVVEGRTGTGQGDYLDLEGSVWAYEGDYLTKVNIIRDGDWDNTYEPIGDGMNSLGQEVKLSDFNTRKDGTKMFDIMYQSLWYIYLQDFCVKRKV